MVEGQSCDRLVRLLPLVAELGDLLLCSFGVESR